MMAEVTHSPPNQFNTSLSRKTNLSRSDSLISLARAPFSVQLHRLTSLSLPSPDSLHTRILEAESPEESLSRLRNIATDVHKWISTASTVLSQLDADDDVEWAARGKDALAKVENAAKRFGEIVEMFLDAATVLSARSDDRVKEEIKELISIMDEVTHGWTNVRMLLKGLREQVALSTEWMEIREILDDISSELDACANMVFELEETRHLNHTSTKHASAGSSPTSSAELDRLSSILEEHSGSSSPGPQQTALLRLSARIQPLRASLDFLKPRLSSFSERAEKTFPTALGEVLQRKADLERRWSKIENDWRGLGRELQEDEWVDVFRNVGKQASDMMDSISRAMMTLHAYLPHTTPPFDFVEHYIAKKTYYPAAINRVLGVLDRGYKNRVTFNGTIGRNYDDLRERWNDIQCQMRKLDDILTDLDAHSVNDVPQQLNRLNAISEGRPQSACSVSSNSTLTQGAVSPTASRASSIRSGTRVTSLPPHPRDVLVSTPTPRNRSVSTTSTSSSRYSRLNIPLFNTKSKIPAIPKSPSLNRSTGGLIPIEARPRWNSSPIANVLGSAPSKPPTVIITPSRIPRSGRTTPSIANPNVTPLRPPTAQQIATPSSASPQKRIPVPLGRAAHPSKLHHMVSNPNLSCTAVAAALPDTPPVSKASEKQSRRISGIPTPMKRMSAIPRPATAQGMNSRNLSGSATPVQPKWRG